MKYSFIPCATLAVALSSVACVSLSTAATTKTIVVSTEAIKARLQKTFDNIKFESVQPSSLWPGLFEVVTESELAYTNADGSLLFAGRILDANTKENLTGKRWNELNRLDIKTLPMDHAIKTVKGDGSRTLVLFSDPDCPFCQELEQELKQVTNVTIYTFLYPLEALHPGARDKANKIWCSQDRASTWSNWMLNRTPAQANCEQNVIDSNIELGMKYKISSTPTLFFSDGHRVSGTIPAQQVEAEIVASK